MRGLDPRIHRKRLVRLMDCRVKPGNDDGGGRDYFPNSFDRAVAAAIARVMISCMPRSPINTSSAAAVVPPGEVTFWRKVAAERSERCNSSPEPATVSRASLVANASGRPAGEP